MFSFLKRALSTLNAEQILSSQVSTEYRSKFEERVIEALKKRHKYLNEMKEKSKYEPRYNGVVKKRQWEDANSSESAASKRPANFDPATRVKRKKSIILFGYSGVNYLGMQRNPGTATIEEDLLTAMRKANWINEECYNNPKQYHFQRVARTDKGVSACRQVVSLKLPLQLDVEALNRELPEQIRVFAVKRVTKGFDAKVECNYRTYSYTLPTIAFADHEEKVEMESYRLPEEKLEKINSVLKLYEGTKNYHNFTAKKAYFDPSVKRFMMSVLCEKPFIVRDTFEFATIKVKGQSFMMHQIRKMVGLALAIIRGLTNAETIEKAFQHDKIDIPTAPGLGLVLNDVHYDRYNNRYGEDGVHEKLEWSDKAATIEEFAEKTIFSTIYETEIEKKEMAGWLDYLAKHSYEPRAENEEEKKSTEDVDE